MQMLGRALVAVLAGVVAPAAAQESGFEIGVRGGAATLLGTNPDRTRINAIAPLWLEIGFRPAESVGLGAYFQYAFGQPAGGQPGSILCPPGSSCSGSIIKTGLELLIRPFSGERFLPWIGVAGGLAFGRLGIHLPPYQSGGVTITNTSTTAHSTSYDLIAQAGVDVRVGRIVSVGPYAALTFTGPPSSSTSATRLEGGIRMSLTP